MGRLFKSYDSKITQAYKASWHNGIDLVGKGPNNVSCLDYIVAHSAGTVVGVLNTYNKNDSTGNSYGNYVKIRHDNGYFTLYAHLKFDSVKVKLGDRVTKEQVIGYMGNTGHSFGAHLHFEIRDKNDLKINPTPFLNSDLPNKINNEYTQEDFIEELKIALGLPNTATLEQIYTKTPKLYNNNTYTKVSVILQKRLISLGFSCGKMGANGYFGNDTEKAVKAYQEKYRTGTVDGYLSSKGYMWKSLLSII